MKEVIAGVPLAQFAAVNAALAEAFPLRAVLAVEEIEAPRWAEADSGWTEELTNDPALLARYEAELARAQARFVGADKKKLTRSTASVGATPATDPVAAPAAPPPPTFLAQQPIYVAPPPPPVEEDVGARAAIAEVPFAPPPVVPSGPPRAVTVALPEQKAKKVTLIGAEASSSVLPFRAAPSPANALPEEPAAAPPPRMRPQTLMVLKPPTSVVLPFQPSSSAPPAEGASALRDLPSRAPQPAAARTDDEHTQPAFIPPAPRLPFRAPDAAESPAEPAPHRGSSDDETTRTGIEVPARSLPFRASADASDDEEPRTNRPKAEERPAKTEPADAAPAAPLAFPSGGWGLPPASLGSPPPPAGPVTSSPQAAGGPPMALERHASICLEIALDPARTAEVLARYKITAEEKARADAYYRTQISVDRDLGARWNQAYAAYHAWFIANARPRS